MEKEIRIHFGKNTSTGCGSVKLYGNSEVVNELEKAFVAFLKKKGLVE